MPSDRSVFALQPTNRGSYEVSPSWSYEDVGAFLLILTILRPALGFFTQLHLLPRSELEHPGFRLQICVIVFLMLVLYLLLKVRYRRPIIRDLGWSWPSMTCAITAPLLGGVLGSGLAACQRGQSQDGPTMPFVEVVILGVVFGPILEESFFRGCLLSILASGVGKCHAVILTAVLFAIFHGPANLKYWASFIGMGLVYGWIRVALGSTTASTLAHAAYNLALLLFIRD